MKLRSAFSEIKEVNNAREKCDKLLLENCNLKNEICDYKKLNFYLQCKYDEAVKKLSDHEVYESQLREDYFRLREELEISKRINNCLASELKKQNKQEISLER